MAVALMKAGNDMVRVIGGRDMHPESATVGGWLHFPSQSELDSLRARLQELRPGAVATINLFNSLPYPELHSKSERFSLHNEKEYVSLRGHDQERRTTSSSAGTTSSSSRSTTSPTMTAELRRARGTHLHGRFPAARRQQLRPALAGGQGAGQGRAADEEPRQPLLQQRCPGRRACSPPSTRPSRCWAGSSPAASRWWRSSRTTVAASAPSKCRGARSGTSTSSTTPATSRHANIITPTAQNLRSIEDDIRLYLPAIARPAAGRRWWTPWRSSSGRMTRASPALPTS